MDKILYDVARRATPKVAMTLWNIAPNAVDVPETLSVVATTPVEEFLMHHGSRIKHLTIFITPDSPQHIPPILPYIGKTLETLDIRSTGTLDCYCLQFLSSLTRLWVNAPCVSRFGLLPTTITSLHISIASSIELDVSALSSLETLHLTAERGHLIGTLPVSLTTLRLRGPNCRPPDVFPSTLQHLECSGMIMDRVPSLPETLKTLNLANTHIEPGQVDFSHLVLDDCCLRGTYLDDHDIERCNASILDVRWTQITQHCMFHPRVETVYTDTIPTPSSVASSRSHTLVLHIGKEPVHHFPMTIVRRNNTRDETNDPESPFVDQPTSVKHITHRAIDCHLWMRTLSIDAVDRLFELMM